MANHNRGFPQPFLNAPYHTHHICSADDFKTTAESTYQRFTAHTINRTVYLSSRERRSNQAVTCKLDPPFRIWLTEKESRRKDYIKSKYEKRGLARPKSHLVTKKELDSHHKKQEIDDYHLSHDVEVCDAVVHPNPHHLGHHEQSNQQTGGSGGAGVAPSSSSPRLNIGHSASMPSLPSIGKLGNKPKAPTSLW